VNYLFYAASKQESLTIVLILWFCVSQVQPIEAIIELCPWLIESTRIHQLSATPLSSDSASTSNMATKKGRQRDVGLHTGLPTPDTTPTKVAKLPQTNFHGPLSLASPLTESFMTAREQQSFENGHIESSRSVADSELNEIKKRPRVRDSFSSDTSYKTAFWVENMDESRESYHRDEGEESINKVSEHDLSPTSTNSRTTSSETSQHQSLTHPFRGQTWTVEAEVVDKRPIERAKTLRRVSGTNPLRERSPTGTSHGRAAQQPPEHSFNRLVRKGNFSPRNLSHTAPPATEQEKHPSPAMRAVYVFGNTKKPPNHEPYPENLELSINDDGSSESSNDEADSDIEFQPNTPVYPTANKRRVN